MTDTAISAIENPGHRDGIGILLRDEYRWMTITAGQPLGMCQMWKTDIRHVGGAFHDAIHVHLYQPFSFPGFACSTDPGINVALSQGLYPVDFTPPVLGEILHRFFWILKDIDCGTLGVMNAILGLFGQWGGADIPNSRKTVPRRQ